MGGNDFLKRARKKAQSVKKILINLIAIKFKPVFKETHIRQKKKEATDWEKLYKMKYTKDQFFIVQWTPTSQ